MAALSRKQIIRHMGHLVQERIHTLRSIAGEEEVDVERDLDHVPMPIPVAAWHHVPERRPHAVAQPEGNVVGKHAVEPRPVEVAVERPQILPLTFATATALRRSAMAAMLRPADFLERAGKLRPIQHDGPSVLRRRRRHTARTNDGRERIEDVSRRGSVGHVDVQCSSSLRQGPDRGSILAKCDTLQLLGATTPQSGSEALGRMQLVHTSKKRKTGPRARAQDVVVITPPHAISRARDAQAIAR